MPNYATKTRWRAYSRQSLRSVVCGVCGRRSRFPFLYGFVYRVTHAPLHHHRETERRCGACAKEDV